LATPTNPLMGGGAPPGAPGGAPGGGMLSTILGALSNRASTNPGQDFSQQSAALQGADPSMVLRQLEAVNQVLGVLFVKTFQTLPNMANQISATMKALSRAIKEGQQASNVTEAVSKNEEGSGQGPINFSPVSQGAVPGADQGATT
jgi:hypothetical protein